MSSRSLLLVGLLPLVALLYLQLSNISLLGLVREKHVDRSQTPIVMGAIPAFSHMEKVTTVAEGLVKLGYPVTFVTGPDFKDDIESIGATYVPIEGKGPGMMSPEDMGTFLSLTGPALEVFAFKTVFSGQYAAQYRTVQRVFRDIKEKYGEEQKIIYMCDFSFGGNTPVYLGAPGIKPEVAISIGVAPYPGASNDTFPFQSGRHPDTSPDSKRIHFEAQQDAYRDYPGNEINADLQKVLNELGAKVSYPGLFDTFALSSDIHFQYGVPEFEYPRSDLRPNFKYVGAPLSVGIAGRALPDWWDDVIEAKKAGKHIVAITTSSAVFDNNALIIPALEALRDREDVLVIATLVNFDVEQLDFKIPNNARVSKFIPLDMALQYIDILITNGGYGTIQHAIRAGVPMIVSGVGQDKLHTGGIINYVGNGIYNPVHEVNQKMIEDAFEEMLKNNTYRKTSRALAKEYEKYNAVTIADETIQSVLRGEYTFQ